MVNKRNGNKRVVYTIGHSTHTQEQFIAIFKHYGIKQVVDIRTIPRSRHNPQFNRDVLGHALRNKHIGYRHMKGLGGLRHTSSNSLNTAWRNKSFRGFADYMQTPKFDQSLEKLIDIAHRKPTVIMCAEAVPWRCHRSLIGDALLAHGIAVIDIFSETEAKEHKLTPWASINNHRISYPG